MSSYHPEVDHVLLNGKIITVDHNFTIAEAVAIRDSRIAAVGTTSEISSLAGSHTRVDDMGGGVVLPGIIDSHNHLLSTSQVLQQIQLYDCRSIGEILERVAERARTARPGEWIVGRGWDETLLAERRHPSRWEIDQIAPNNPVVLHRVWNKLTANSAAITAAGVRRDTPDPPADELYAGGFERDEHGEPAGLFRDRAKELILRAIPEPTNEDLVQALSIGCRAYNAVGITGVAEPGLGPRELRVYQTTHGRGKLSVRTDMLLGGWGYVPATREPELKRWISEMGVYSGFGDDVLRLGGVKFLLDGGVGDRTARMNHSYEGEPGNHGQWAVDPEEAPELIRWVHDQGWSIDAHTCGDAAQDLAVRAFIAAQTASPNASLHHRVHHAYVPAPETIQLMGRHGIPALVSNPFLVHLGDSFVESLGTDRAARALPMASYLRAGVPLAGSSDSPIADFNPWVGMYAAIARRSINGWQFDPAEAIGIEDALRSYTITGAAVLGLSEKRGSIAPGNVADLIQLDRDPLRIDVEALKETRVQRTMVAGSWVYES
ncbi:MAG: amidohydrolase [Nitrolancea sp.]